MSEGEESDAPHEVGDEFELVKEEDMMLVNLMGLEQMTLNLDGLKASVDDGLKAVVREMRSSEEKLDAAIESVGEKLKAVVQNENFDAKLDTLSGHVSSINTEISKMHDSLCDIKRELMEEREKKALERAAMLTHLNAFEYYEEDADGYWVAEKSSAGVAKEAIQWFLLGAGYTLPDATTARANFAASGALKAALRDHSYIGMKRFRDDFAKQIKELTKEEPRVVRTEGKWTIYLK